MASPGIPGLPPPAAQLQSSLFPQSKVVLRLAASDGNLMDYRKAYPQTPIFFRSLFLTWLQTLYTQPLQGAPRCSPLAAMPAHFRHLHLYASPTAASHGTVGSTMYRDSQC